MTENKNQKDQEIVEACPHCGSDNVYAITRVTGYFSKTSMWNKGKIAEFKDRERNLNKEYFSKA